MDRPVRVRMAPSPTGFVHIGSLRTALFDYLFARKNGGTLVLRIEDTDQNRFVEGAVENMLRVFAAVGLEFDEGLYLDQDGRVKERGNFGPYRQSERLERYAKAADRLIENGSAYYCFCDEQRLDELRKEQVALKKPPMYDRRCRHLSRGEVEQKLAELRTSGKRPVVRQAVPDGGSTTIEDLIYGKITYEHRFLDDQILLKSDGFPTYHLAVVVDDHEMQISHVLRGEEWIPSTPKHILLYRAFGWQPPEFAHLPLILNPDKSKLSKRQGDVAVEDYLKKGYLPEALLNFVAFLGWNPKTEREFFTLSELAAEFDLEKVNKAGAVFDTHKLDWINSHYLRQRTPSELAVLLRPHWAAAGISLAGCSDDFLAAVAKLEQDRLKKLSEIGERTGYFFSEPAYDPNLLVWKKSDVKDTVSKLTALLGFFKALDPKTLGDPTALEAALRAWIQANAFDTGSVLWSLRVALTGLPASPGPFEVAAVLTVGYGPQKVLERIARALTNLTG